MITNLSNYLQALRTQRLYTQQELDEQLRYLGNIDVTDIDTTDSGEVDEVVRLYEKLNLIDQKIQDAISPSY